MEVIWKVCASIFNNILWSTTTLNGVLYGFRQGRWKETSPMESKLAQQSAGLCHEPLFQVFIDVRKSYISLEIVSCMEILMIYGLKPNLERLLHSFWGDKAVVPKAGKCF